MSETKKSIRDEPWFKNVPEYMGEAIVLITETRDEARMLLARLQDREQVLGDRETALLSAIADMKEFANQLYGPNSELTKINTKLDAMEEATATRDASHAKQIELIKQQVDGLSSRVTDTEEAVKELQRKIA